LKDLLKKSAAVQAAAQLVFQVKCNIFLDLFLIMW